MTFNFYKRRAELLKTVSLKFERHRQKSAISNLSDLLLTRLQAQQVVVLKL